MIFLLYEYRQSKRSYSNDNQAVHLLNPFHSTTVGSSYVAVEDDGTVTISHNTL